MNSDIRNNFSVSGKPLPRVFMSWGLCRPLEGADIVKDYVGNMLVTQYIRKID